MLPPAAAEDRLPAERLELDADVERFLREAESLPPTPCRANTDVVLVNVCHAAAQLSTPEVAAVIGSDLNNVEERLVAEAPRLATALNYLAHKAAPPRRPPVTLPELERARELRRKLLLTLACAVEWKVVPRPYLDGLSKGNAKTDLAHALVNAVAILREFAKPLENKTLVTPELMKEAEELGCKILQHAKVGSPLAAKARQEKSAQVQARDRLYSLLLQRYERMRRIGFWVWGAAASRHVPPLRSAPRRPRPSAASRAAQGAPPLPTVASVPEAPSPSPAPGQPPSPVTLQSFSLDHAQRAA